MKALTEKQQFWQQHVLQAQSHIGSIADYAKQQQLKVASLYYWISVFSGARQTKKSTLSAASFSAVRVSPSATAHCQIQLPSRVMMQCSALPDPQWLAELCRQMDAAT